MRRLLGALLACVLALGCSALPPTRWRHLMSPPPLLGLPDGSIS